MARRLVGRAAALAAVVVALTATTSTQSTTARPPAIDKSVKVGSGLYEIVASSSTGTVYVASAGSRNQPGAAVLALDGNTLDVVKTIDVSAAPAYGIALNDRTQTLYTTNTRNASVSAIDLKTGRITPITSEADKSAHLREVIVDEAANVVYASSFGNTGIVWVIDGRTNTLSHLLENVGNGTAGLALDAAAGRLYVTNANANEIAVIDTAAKSVIRRFPAGGERPTNLTLDTKTGRLFVANQGPGNVTVLEAGTGKLLATLPGGARAGTLDVELSPAANLVYAANRGNGTVSIFDATTYAPVATLDTGGAPNTLAVHGATGKVYVTKKARPTGGRGRGGDAGAAAPAPAPVDDGQADTVTIIRP
jgi:YVTN family beta-propeller protein